MLERTARVYADREAYKWFEHRTNEWVGITWRQFSERVMRWRKAFAKMGLQRGARVAMLLPNSVDALTTRPATPTTFSTTAVPNSSLRLTLRVGIRWPQPELICLTCVRLCSPAKPTKA